MLTIHKLRRGPARPAFSLRTLARVRQIPSPSFLGCWFMCPPQLVEESLSPGATKRGSHLFFSTSLPMCFLSPPAVRPAARAHICGRFRQKMVRTSACFPYIFFPAPSLLPLRPVGHSKWAPCFFFGIFGKPTLNVCFFFGFVWFFFFGFLVWWVRTTTISPLRTSRSQRLPGQSPAAFPFYSNGYWCRGSLRGPVNMA